MGWRNNRFYFVKFWLNRREHDPEAWVLGRLSQSKKYVDRVDPI